jgi:hypothetical protein
MRARRGELFAGRRRVPRVHSRAAGGGTVEHAYGEMVEYPLNWSARDLSDGAVISGTGVVRVWGCAAAAGSR